MKEEKELTGYPSIDKPWLKYYSEEAIQAEIPESSLYEYLYENNKNAKDSIALNYMGKKMTYGELFDRIDQVARAFVSQGVKSGETVTLVTLSCIPSVLCLYALNKIGAIVNFVNVLASQEELEHYILDAESQVVVTLDLFGEKVLHAAKRTSVHKIIFYSLAENMPSVLKIGYSIKMREFKKDFLEDKLFLPWNTFLIEGSGRNINQYRKDARTACYLAHTGGTTGFPKSVFLNDIAFNAVTQNYILSMPHERGQIFLCTMIPYVVYGTLINIHMPLCLGLETVIIPKFDPDEWPQYIKKYRPNHCCSIPAYVAPMLDNPQLNRMDLSNLLTVGLGGDGMNVPLENDLNSFLKSAGSPAKIQKGYGMTETCATAIVEFKNAGKVGSVGIPLVKNIAMAYDNENQRECHYGETGEICMQCASTMIGYKDNETEMKNLFRVHPDGSVWIHTGDLGYIDEDGFVFLIGRLKRMIMTVIDGAVYKIVPSRVEEEINKHENVQDSCVVSSSDGKNKVLKAFVVAKKDVKTTELEKELRALCKEVLSENMRPMFYEFRESLPLTKVGKVDYRVLEAEEE